jgi:two-component system response regulator RegX3
MALMTSGYGRDPADEGSAQTRRRVLLVEDRGPLHDALVETLHGEGYDVSTTGNVSDTLHQLQARRPDLALIDLMLSDGSGMEIYRQVSGLIPVPMIALAPVEAEAEVLKALRSGAVDYATRPLDGRALISRIRIVLARFPRRNESPADAVIAVGPLSIELSRRQVSLRGASVYLAKMEYDLLLALARRPGEILTRRELFDEIWAGRSLEDTSTLDVHIRRIRRKIELDPGHPELLVTARGVGYYLEDGRRS